MWVIPTTQTGCDPLLTSTVPVFGTRKKLNFLSVSESSKKADEKSRKATILHMQLYVYIYRPSMLHKQDCLVESLIHFCVISPCLGTPPDPQSLPGQLSWSKSSRAGHKVHVLGHGHPQPRSGGTSAGYIVDYRKYLLHMMRLNLLDKCANYSYCAWAVTVVCIAFLQVCIFKLLV